MYLSIMSNFKFFTAMSFFKPGPSKGYPWCSGMAGTLLGTLLEHFGGIEFSVTPVIFTCRLGHKSCGTRAVSAYVVFTTCLRRLFSTQCYDSTLRVRVSTLL